MALTYEESAALMVDNTFRGRVKVACLKYAAYISNEQANVPAHNTRVKWAQQTMAQPDMVVQQIQPPTVMDDKVQAAGSAVTDENLQTAVETTVNKMI